MDGRENAPRSEGTRRYRIATAAGGVIGCDDACPVPYAPLLNVLYGPNGYLGFALIASMVAHDGRLLKTQKEK